MKVYDIIHESLSFNVGDLLQEKEEPNLIWIVVGSDETTVTVAYLFSTIKEAHILPKKELDDVIRIGPQDVIKRLLRVVTKVFSAETSPGAQRHNLMNIKRAIVNIRHYIGDFKEFHTIERSIDSHLRQLP